MPTTFTNNWKKILDKLESTIRTEFKNALPTYKGFIDESAGSQYLRIIPSSSNLLEYNLTSETREFNIDMILHIKSANIKETALDHIFRLVSRLESLVVDNISMTLADNSNLFNCRIESTSFDSTNSEEHIVTFDFRGTHMSNIS